MGLALPGDARADGAGADVPHRHAGPEQAGRDHAARHRERSRRRVPRRAQRGDRRAWQPRLRTADGGGEPLRAQLRRVHLRGGIPGSAVRPGRARRRVRAVCGDPARRHPRRDLVEAASARPSRLRRARPGGQPASHPALGLEPARRCTPAERRQRLGAVLPRRRCGRRRGQRHVRLHRRLVRGAERGALRVRPTSRQALCPARVGARGGRRTRFRALRVRVREGEGPGSSSRRTTRRRPAPPGTCRRSPRVVRPTAAA